MVGLGSGVGIGQSTIDPKQAAAKVAASKHGGFQTATKPSSNRSAGNGKKAVGSTAAKKGTSKPKGGVAAAAKVLTAGAEETKPVEPPPVPEPAPDPPPPPPREPVIGQVKVRYNHCGQLRVLLNTSSLD